MALAATLHCPCAGRHRRPTFAYDAPPAGETRFDLEGTAYQRSYEACALCGHWFGRHEIDLSRLYHSDYVTATYGDAGGMRRRYESIMALPPERSDNRRRVERVLSFARQHGMVPDTSPRLLDIGAGLGVFPAAMRMAGWQTTALEPDPRAAAHLTTVAGVTTLLSSLDTGASTERYQAVTLNKVLEHVEDPVAMLREASAFLANGGFVYVEVPDIAAEAAGPGREEFFIEHHHVFSPASLAILFERAGLPVSQIERLIEPSGKYTVYAFSQPRHD